MGLSPAAKDLTAAAAKRHGILALTAAAKHPAATNAVLVLSREMQRKMEDAKK